MGGANWPPSSYDPETHLLYVCASDRINSFSGPTLVGGLPLETIVAVSQAGRNAMPAFGRVYTEADLRDVATYVLEVLAE
jgi:hypothetical protein